MEKENSQNADVYPVCADCGSESVLRDAWAAWDRKKQDWVLSSTFDGTFCEICDQSRQLKWLKENESEAERTRRLNDEMREVLMTERVRAYGSFMLTRGVAELGEEQLAKVIAAVSAFEDFDADNDPYEEHDFGSVEFEGETFFWKIDYFDLDRRYHSPDKSDIAVTHRVLTVMLGSEY